MNMTGMEFGVRFYMHTPLTLRATLALKVRANKGKGESIVLHYNL